jgi:hypothetical protein
MFVFFSRFAFHRANAQFTRPESYVAFVALCEAPQKARNFLGLSATPYSRTVPLIIIFIFYKK